LSAIGRDVRTLRAGGMVRCQAASRARAERRHYRAERSGANMVADEYALEKFRQAMHALDAGGGRVQERLADAAIFLIRVRPEDISDEDLRRTFIGVMDDLSYAQARSNEGRILATLKITNDEDANAIARRIVHLYHALDRSLR
jgi:hypothetical protein